MTNSHKLSECSDMTEEKFKECFERIDMKMFIENPTQALIDAGVTLKKGVTFKFVETEEAANALPANVFPLIRTQKNNEELSMQNLDKVVGGVKVDGGWARNHTDDKDVPGFGTVFGGGTGFTSKQ